MIMMTTSHYYREDGRKMTVVDRAWNDHTMKPVITPEVHPKELGATYDPESGCWFILEKEDKSLLDHARKFRS